MTEKLLNAFSTFTVFLLGTLYVSVKHIMSDVNNVLVLARSMACLFNEYVFKGLILNKFF